MECLFMVKPMVVGFVLLGVDAAVDNGRGIWEHLNSFKEVEYLQSYCKTFRMGI